MEILCAKPMVKVESQRGESAAKPFRRLECPHDGSNPWGRSRHFPGPNDDADQRSTSVLASRKLGHLMWKRSGTRSFAADALEKFRGFQSGHSPGCLLTATHPDEPARFCPERNWQGQLGQCNCHSCQSAINRDPPSAVKRTLVRNEFTRVSDRPGAVVGWIVRGPSAIC